MSSNGNTWGRQGGRSAACNSLMEGVERRRARGDRGLSQGTKRMRERQRDGEEKEVAQRRRGVCGESTKRRQRCRALQGIRRGEDEGSIIASYPFCEPTRAEDSFM